MPYKDPIIRREKHREYMREVWYPRNRQRQYDAVKRNKAKIRDFIRGLKISCCRCSEEHPATLDFHHYDTDKSINISNIINKGWGVDRILAEISKCTVLCSNCHRKLHW